MPAHVLLMDSPRTYLVLKQASSHADTVLELTTLAISLLLGLLLVLVLVGGKHLQLVLQLLVGTLALDHLALVQFVALTLEHVGNALLVLQDKYNLREMNTQNGVPRLTCSPSSVSLRCFSSFSCLITSFCCSFGVVCSTCAL